MKKFVMIGLALVCAIALAAVAAFAVDAFQEETTTTDAQVSEATRVEGIILTIEDGYLTMQEKDLGEIQVNLSDETVYEGVELAPLAVGQYVYVDFDGKMTRSLPPQIAALKVAVYPVSGTVTEIGEGSVTIEQANGAGEAIVFLPEGASEPAVGDAIVAYTNGAMTMSLPPQTTAMHVVVGE